MSKKAPSKTLSKREALLIEATYHLAKGTGTHMGLELEDIIIFLKTPMRGREFKTMIECLSEDREVLDKLISHINNS